MNALVPNHRRSFAILLLLLCQQLIAMAQPKAAFTASPAEGCSPLVVFFTDQSTGSPSEWKWDLGNGVTATRQNPSATYFNPGTYNVKLFVKSAAGSDSLVKSQFVTVHSSPAVLFDIDKNSGCFPLAVNLRDKSTPGSGTVANWQWDFGDGTVSSAPAPSHTYTSAGSFSVSLRISNSFGCVKTVTQANAINVSSGVKAGFTFTDPGACAAPATSQFTNSSQGPGPLQYQWWFGDGSTSTAADPQHTYAANGTYTVRLAATSPQGCSDTITRNEILRIGGAKADFTLAAPACQQSALPFTNTSKPAPVAAKWNFGDGTQSSLLNPVKTYATAGTYTVQLISFFGACSDTITKSITVGAKPVVDFTTDNQVFCSVPAVARFTESGSQPTSLYYWDFGDGNTTAGMSPMHQYDKQGAYAVKLVVVSEAGCTDSLSKPNFIRLAKPHVTVSGLPKNGCLPLAIAPTAASASGIIKAYEWFFGDGSTSTAAAPSHIYTKAGIYDVKLLATMETGCTDTVLLPSAVRVGEKPHAAFVNTPLDVCPAAEVFFTDKSTGTIDQWSWNFGDGGTSGLQNPVHQYSDTGWMNVTLIVSQNTCADTTVVRRAVHVNPPISAFVVQNNCADRYTKNFLDKSIAPETWLWNFGDGTTSGEPSPVHTYGAPGTYTVRLTVTNKTCTHTSEQTVFVIDEKADFTTADSVICRKGTATFQSQGINKAIISSWQWSFGDGSFAADTLSSRHVYNRAGTFTVTLTITDRLGCQSTSLQFVKVYGPTAAFNMPVTAACLRDNNLSFSDQSSTDGQHALVKWIWSYGDGKTDSVSAAPFLHRYDTAGLYTVGLTVVDDFGCRDNTSQASSLTIAQPQALFSVSDTLTCTEKNIAFLNNSSGLSPQFQWSFGDGQTSTNANPMHAYANVGLYAIKLLVTDRYGCKDSLLKKDLVRVTYPKAKFSLSDSVGTCPPLLVNFTNQSANYQSVRWDFGDGNASTLEAPSHFYSMPGTYYASLVVTAAGGCTDTLQRKIVVKGPSGSFQYTPLTGCKPLQVAFTSTTKNAASFIWDFSDGTTEAAASNTNAHTYTTAGEFVPKLILTDAAGCAVPITGTDTVHVLGVSTRFSLDASRFCDQGNVQFTNNSVSNDLISGYRWNFGDGTTSTEANPAHQYAAPGNYSVALLTTTQSGCTGKMELTDTVNVFSSPAISISGDTASCAPAMFSFNGQVQSGNPAKLQWAWDFGNGQSSSLPVPEPQHYLVDGRYTVTATVTDNNGCRNTASHVATVHPLPTTNAGSDQWICRGTAVQLHATGADQYQWQAAPSLSCTGCAAPLAAPTDSVQYIVRGTTLFGCSTNDTVRLRVHQPFKLTVGKSDTICAGSIVHLTASGADKYSWTPAINVQEPGSAITIATPQVSTLYTVTAKDNANCFADTGSVYIKVWPMPKVTVSSEHTLSIGSTMAINPVYSSDVSSYVWNPAQTLSCANCPAPVARPKTETRYVVEAKNDGGCQAKAAITVHVICNDGNLFIPNTFSPNTDGRNDRFYPRGTGISRIRSLRIYNRWGEMVFSRDDFDANSSGDGWDGKFKGSPLAPDVYVYTCEVVCMNNELLQYKGDVTLLR